MRLQIYLSLWFLLLRVGRTSVLNSSSQYLDIEPVYDGTYKLLANDDFCLGFSGLSRKQLLFGIFINWRTNPELVWSPPKSPYQLDLGSRLFTNGSLLVLRNSRNQIVWQVKGVGSCELTDEGNLQLYKDKNSSDPNNSVVWQSWDYPSDSFVLGQPFANISDVVLITGKFLNISFGTGPCIFSLELDTPIKSAELGLSNKMEPFLALRDNNGSFLRQSQIYMLNRIENSACFLRTGVKTMYIYSYSAGSWSVQLVTIDQQLHKLDNSRTSCPKQSITWFHRLEFVLGGLSVMLLCFQVLVLVNLHKKLVLLAICSLCTCSIAITLFCFQNLSYARPIFSEFSGAANVLMLYLVNLALCCIFTTSEASRKVLVALIVLYMLTILSTNVGVIALHSLYKRRSIGYAFGYFVSPSFLAATNAISLILLKLSVHNLCSPFVHYAMIIAANSATIFFSLFLTISLGSRSEDAFWTCLLILNTVVMLVLTLACYSHRLIIQQCIQQFIVETIQSITAVKTAISLWCSMQKKRLQVSLVACLLGRPNLEPDTDDDIAMSLSSYSYEELEVFTDQFSYLVGRGGFGGVYKGLLLDGRKVAVKKLESTSQGKREFKAEIEILGKIHHVNLAGLLGFCAEGLHRLLVYELMANGSLDKWISVDGPFLDWKTRMKILVGTARGLAYLHEECDPRIIHLDVKPQNILLDEDFNAKVSDFGLCKILSRDETSLIMTRIMGTMGYLAPEWVHGTVTEKTDIYSFGIVVLEVVSGIRNYTSIDQSFRTWAIKQMEQKILVDPRLLDSVDEGETNKVVEIALWCTESDPNMRPTMGSVLKMLDGTNESSYLITTHDDEDDEAPML